MRRTPCSLAAFRDEALSLMQIGAGNRWEECALAGRAGITLYSDGGGDREMQRWRDRVARLLRVTLLY
jgi:hypothetical protein